MKTSRHALTSAICYGATLLFGCATSTRYLELSRMAGFVGTRPGKMYVVNIEGQDAEAFRDQLYKALVNDGHFIPERYGVAPTGNGDSASNLPCIALSGIHGTHESTSFVTEGSGDNQKKYRELTETHNFQYSIKDAGTGEELDANMIVRENVSKEEAKDASFLDQLVGGVVKGALEDLFGVEAAHRKELIRDFVAALRLHYDRRSVGLFQDKDIPELKEGVEFVLNGNWLAAIARFQAGAEGHPNNQALHKAYFDLGVAFEYNHDFERALASLRLADELAPREGYAAEIEHCQWFARQYRWQQRYAGSPSEVAR